MPYNVFNDFSVIFFSLRKRRVTRERNVFGIHVFQYCVRSHNPNIQRLVAELCRVMLRGLKSNTANPVEVLIRATKFHQQFRVSNQSIHS